MIDGIKKALQQRIGESFEQLCLLQEARQQVQADLQDKNIALGIDVDQYNLTDRSSQISYKPDSLRVPKGYVCHCIRRNLLVCQFLVFAQTWIIVLGKSHTCSVVSDESA